MVFFWLEGGVCVCVCVPVWVYTNAHMYLYFYIHMNIYVHIYKPAACQVASVVSDSVRPHGLQPTRLLHPWDFPGNSTGVGCHCLLPYTNLHVFIYLHYTRGFPGDSDGKESACNAGHLGSSLDW